MFEHFSFPPQSSSSPGDDRLMLDCDSTAISPLSSRCPSPSPYISRRPHPLSRSRSPYMRRPQPPTSMPSNYEEFQRRISVGTLTEKLNAHTLDQSACETPLTPISPTSFAFSVTEERPSRASMRSLLTPPGDYEDEGYDDQLTPGWEPYHHHSEPPTSMPAEPNNLLLHPPPRDMPHRISCQRSLRSQRQQMSRAQCNIDVLKLALMAEDFTRRSPDPTTLSDDECHPSSMPLDTYTPRRSSAKPRLGAPTSGSGSLDYRPRASPDFEDKVRRKSALATFASSTRIAKPRLRDLHSKKSEQTLRRTSLVYAGLYETTMPIPRSSSP